MRSHVTTMLLAGALTALAAAGCSATTEQAAAPEPAPPAATPGGGPPGVSPGGVTTRVDVPAGATESQYGQACLAAKRWMDDQGGDPQTLVEPYLKILQAPGFTGPGSFDTTWVELTPAEQAGVIMAAQGAADGMCS